MRSGRVTNGSSGGDRDVECVAVLHRMASIGIKADAEDSSRQPRETVGEAVGADELPGLVSSLISLGSAGVVASVVPVNDPATVPLMLALHDHLRGGYGLAEALPLARHAVSADSVARSTAYSFIALGT
jgi:CHAT domain